MLIISTPENQKIPYHNKVITSVKNKIIQLDPKLLQFNWILSGSFAVNSLYSPNQDFNDIDFYFSSQQDFDDCYQYLLSNVDHGSYCTDNAITFNDLNLQLINKWFLPPQELIYSHDFINVSVAITKDNIYTTKETNYSWYNEHLSLRNFQISKDPPATDFETVTALNILNSRVLKYLARYEFSLSPSFKKFYYEQLAFLNNIDPIRFSQNEAPVYNYYGNLVDHSNAIKNAICSINQLLGISTYDNWGDLNVF